MSLAIPATTAELVVGAVEAVVVYNGRAGEQQVADFLDLSAQQAGRALELAVMLDLIEQSQAGEYLTSSPLARLLVSPVLSQRSAVLRVALESFQPFRIFRERLHQTGLSPSVAAQQTKAMLGLTSHREDIKDTLISLGTYCQSIRTTGGGQYEVERKFGANLTKLLDDAVGQLSDAEIRVSDWLDEAVRNYADRDNVVRPLAEAYWKATQGDPRGAVVSAGNATESFLVQVAADFGLNVASAHGLGAKLEVFRKAAKLPPKVVAIGKYLSNVRNAADHGIDSDIGAAWEIRSGTGEDYLRVAVTFLGVVMTIRDGGQASL